MALHELAAPSAPRTLLVGGVSRSGTTLLCAILDSAPMWSFGAELIYPPEGLSPGEPYALKQETATSRVSKLSRRSGITEEDWTNGVRALSNSERRTRDSVMDLNLALMRQRALRERSAVLGFKWNRGSAQNIFTDYPETQFLVIVRHPSEVLRSQIVKGFKRAPQEILLAWTKVYSSYLEMQQKSRERVKVIRYEDLLRSPFFTLRQALNELSLPFHPKMLAHESSNSAILNSGHANTTALNRPISNEGKDSPRQKLEDFDVYVQGKTKDLMAQLGYSPSRANRLNTLAIPASETRMLRSNLVKRKPRDFEAKRKFRKHEYEQLVEELAYDHRLKTLKEYTILGHQGDENVLLIRHDIDHDIENAVRIAKWEAGNGIKSTYCVLHTAWYYGDFVANRYLHSTLLEESIKEIQSLGHEINLHNNLITLGLQEGVDPSDVLWDELCYLRSQDIVIDGTSTHGDKLCRQLDYRNFELFAESVGSRFGGPRLVTNPETGFSVETGRLSYKDFGLSYEAYDLRRDLYVTDSGGRMRRHTDAAGRRDFGRDGENGRVAALLTHPVWWGGF